MKMKAIFGIVAALVVLLASVATAAEPAWVELETLTVDANSSTPETSMTLEAGWLYRFEVSGTYLAGGPYEADAEYTTLDGWSNWVDGIGSDLDLLDLKVDGSFVNWGTYNPSHVYTMDYVGTGSTVDFVIYDTNYSNNSGSLTVKILATPVMVSTAIISGPETVEVGEPNCWEIEITVEAKYANVTDVVVQDGMGADLDANDIPVSITTGDAEIAKKTKGQGKHKMRATMVTWTVGALNDGDSETIVVQVCTGYNPKDKQEFTSAEEDHELDGGASATYLYGDPELEYESPETVPVTVDVVEP